VTKAILPPFDQPTILCWWQNFNWHKFEIFCPSLLAIFPAAKSNTSEEPLTFRTAIVINAAGKNLPCPHRKCKTHFYETHLGCVHFKTKTVSTRPLGITAIGGHQDNEAIWHKLCLLQALPERFRWHVQLTDCSGTIVASSLKARPIHCWQNRIDRQQNAKSRSRLC